MTLIPLKQAPPPDQPAPEPQVGAGPQPQTPSKGLVPIPDPTVDTTDDVIRSSATYGARGAIGAFGAGGNIRDMASHAVDWISGKLQGRPLNDQEKGVVGQAIDSGAPILGILKYAPTSDQVVDFAKHFMRNLSEPGGGPGMPNIQDTGAGGKGALDYEPKTEAGKRAARIAEVTGGALVPIPGAPQTSLLTHTLGAVGAGLGSEGLGDLAHKYYPPLEPAARMVGGVIGGLTGGFAGSRAPERYGGMPREDANTPAAGTARANVDTANELTPPVPLSRGQATEDPLQQSKENLARTGAQGDRPLQTLSDFDQAQRDAVEAAKRNVAGPGPAAAPMSESERMGNITTGVQQAETRSSAAIDEAYRRAHEAGVEVQHEGIGRIPQDIRQELDQRRILVDANTPYAQAALNDIQEAIQGGGATARATDRGALAPGEQTTGMDLSRLERVRQGLLERARNAGSPEDARAVRRIIQAWDNSLDAAGTQGLISGGEEGLDLFRTARQLRRDHADRFESSPLQRDTAAGKIVESLTGKLGSNEMSPADLANTLVGLNKAGESSLQLQVVRRLDRILNDPANPNPGAWDALRRSYLERMTGRTALDGTDVGPVRAAQRLREFATGKGDTTARILFNPDELAQMQRLADTMETTAGNPLIKNPSGTHYGEQRAARAAESKADHLKTVQPGIVAGGTIGSGVGSTLGFDPFTSGQVGAAVGAVGAPAASFGQRFMRDWRERRAATQATTQPVPQQVGPWLGGAASQLAAPLSILSQAYRNR